MQSVQSGNTVQRVTRPDTDAALQIDHLSKRFGGALALDNVSMTVRRGEVHGLLGSNGSGKSTLIKILAGFHTPEPGAELRLYGTRLSLPVKASQLRDYGLAFVHQHLGLVPSLSVTENLYLGKLASENNWRISWALAHQNAAEVFARFDLDLDPTVEVGSLSPVQQALLAIVRAYEDLQGATSTTSATTSATAASAAAENARPGVLVLDEPTPFLPHAGIEQLFQLIRQCVDQGSSVIFVSHDVDEVREITQRATILRDGRLVDCVSTAATSHEAFVSRIVGHALDAYAGAAKPVPNTPTRLGVSDLRFGHIGPASFTAATGEILGLTGLIGSGSDTVPSLLYGARKGAAGTLMLDDDQLQLEQLSPERALASGIAYLPADRLGEAGVGSLSVANNVALPVLHKLRGALGLGERRIQAHAAALGADAGVKPNVPGLPLAALSGGNAQKALMAKWLQIAPRVLLLDEPTQGVDVGARQQLWDALDATAASGTTIVIASTDYEQLAAVCHRVLIFSQGQIVSALTGQDLNKELIAEHCYRSMSRIA